MADAQAALDTAAKAYEKSKQETEFQNRQNNLDAQTAALDIEKQQAVVDALAALAENDGVLKAGSAGTVETLTLNRAEPLRRPRWPRWPRRTQA